MAGSPNKFSMFWQELKDRKTDRVIIAYAAAAFAILQFAEILFNRLSFPEWTMNLIIIILAVGFPVAAILSWFFDITPTGIEKTKPAGERKKDKMDAEIKKWKRTTLISFVIIIILLLYNITTSFFGSVNGSKERSIAVQPFKCLNEDSELRLQSAMFTYMINGTLTSLENITLKTWPPNLNFMEDERSYPEIGRKLGISYILRGTMAKFTSKIICVVQLIRINNQSLAWGKGYELDTVGGKFTAIQSDIAINIASALKAELSEKEKNMINTRS